MKKYIVSDYLDLLKSLLPRGRAWTRDVTSVLSQLLYGEADELARVDVRINKLVDVERDTRTTDELLGEHENDLGLPDDCSPELGTIIERRRQLHTKFISIGGQNKQYYIDLAEALGFVIKIVEYVYNRYHWSVISQSSEIIYFICGSSECGDFLSFVPPAEILECTLNKLKPAHTVIDFKYSDYGFGAGFGPGFDTVWKLSIPKLEGGFGRGWGIGFDVRYGGGFGRGFGRGYDRVEITPDKWYGLGFGPGFGPGWQKPFVLGW